LNKSFIKIPRSKAEPGLLKKRILFFQLQFANTISTVKEKVDFGHLILNTKRLKVLKMKIVYLDTHHQLDLSKGLSQRKGKGKRVTKN